MATKVLSWDSKEGIAQLELDSGEKVLVGGSFINRSTYSCYATIKNIIGLPIKRIWKLALISNPKTEQNLIQLDFYKYPPFFAIVGYATQFTSIDEMRQAQGRHAELFDAQKAIDTLIEMGLIREKE